MYTTFTDDKVISSFRKGFDGFTAKCTSAGVLNIYDGTDNSGVLVFSISLANGESVITFSPKAVLFNDGIFVETSGTITGTVFHD